ncbi:MAG: hypothetical protein D6790_10780 [Caldilineae bacterium]|nr:MAG: hypothetical protein D6790_10780 [Caldilineae bacterium]
MMQSPLFRGAIGLTMALLLGIVPAQAQNDNVVDTKHNLSVSSGGTDPTGGNLVDYGEVCVYCHTPHGGQTSAPLWNRNFSSATYSMYDANHSSTIDMTVDSQPTGISMACLSCHDGTIGLDVIINAPNSYSGSIPPTVDGVNTMPPGNTLLDTDLRNDHPISVAYDPSKDTAFNTAASVKAAGLKLYVDESAPGVEKVQCASCHNPHNNTYAPLLRIDNSASNLCLTCHIK